MGGAARLVRVIPLDGPFLVAIERFDRHGDIENPRLIQERRHTGTKVILSPLHPRRLSHLAEIAPYRVLADDRAHSQSRGIDAVC